MKRISHLIANKCLYVIKPNQTKPNPTQPNQSLVKYDPLTLASKTREEYDNSC